MSARNHFRGVVREVKVEGLLAQVELDVTEPARVVAIITRDAAEELGLAPGMPASAVVKATSVMVELRASHELEVRAAFTVFSTVATVLALSFLLLPVLAIFLRVSPGDLLGKLDDGVVRDALVVTAVTNGIAFGITLLVGTPAAYLLATRRFPGRPLVVTLCELPLVLPPAVAGIGLLAAFGRLGLLGGTLDDARRPDRLHPGGRRARDPVRRRAVLPPACDRRLRGGRPDAARRGPHARRRPGAHVRARGAPARRAAA